jgi:hypothetical protein
MNRIRTIGVVLLALFAFSAVVATAAQAEEQGPYWSIEGTRLAAGKTFEVAAKQIGAQTLSAKPDAVACSSLSWAPGSVLLGSNGSEPGKADATITYKGCTVTGNGEECEIENGEVKTVPLSAEPAYSSNKKSVVLEFKPTTGKTLATIKFTGTCTISPSTTVAGEVVAGVLTDAEPPVLLELGTTPPQATSFLLKLTNKAKEKIFLVKGGTGTEVETEEVTAFGHSGSLGGISLISLAVKGTTVTKSWSLLY